MSDKKELWIGGGIVALLLVLYFLHKQPVPVVDTSQVNPVTSNASGPPTYNMPPSLMLPPFNVGNTPGTVVPQQPQQPQQQTVTTNCNACTTAQNTNVHGSSFSFGDFSSGIKDSFSLPASSSVLPKPANIVPPPALKPYVKLAHTYNDWYAQATQTGSYAPGVAVAGRFGTTIFNGIDTSKIAAVSNIPPGLTGRQIYFLYQTVNGHYLSTLSGDVLQSAVAQAYASPA